MRRPTSRMLADERGATAVEYGLIVSLIVLAMFGALNGVAGVTTNLWTMIANEVDTHRS